MENRHYEYEQEVAKDNDIVAVSGGLLWLMFLGFICLLGWLEYKSDQTNTIQPNKDTTYVSPIPMEFKLKETQW